MKVVNTVAELKSEIQQAKELGKYVGLVPTMGALHNGHITLVKRCKAENDVCVVSIFVNPTQFNNANDLKHYPRTLEADCKLLEAVNADIVFAPSVEEVYPEEDTRQFNFGDLEKVMEGAQRPGHFNGVAQIVSKLFYMVEPHRAYFGEKDYQQLAIIRAMVADYNIPVEIIPCPIVREEDGLAMSSRNTRLNAAQRTAAPLIHEILLESKIWAMTNPIATVIETVVDELNECPEFEVEYYEIADAKTLQSATEWGKEGDCVGFIAVNVGDVRLIDNIVY